MLESSIVRRKSGVETGDTSRVGMEWLGVNSSELQHEFVLHTYLCSVIFRSKVEYICLQCCNIFLLLP